MHSTLGRLLALLALWGSSTALVAADPATISSTGPERAGLAESAFQTFLDGQQRWAYSETISYLNPDGTLASQSMVLVDPSQPYARQRVPAKINGVIPTEKQLQAWEKAGETEARRRFAPTAELAAARREQEFRLRLINREVRPQFDQASAIAEDASEITYEIPLRELGGPDAPMVSDHRLTVRVSRQYRVFTHATLSQTKMVRIAAGKYSDGVVEVDFAPPGEHYVPIPVRLSTTLTNKPLFGPAHASKNVTERQNFRPVTPYDERFQVKLAPLQLIKF